MGTKLLSDVGVCAALFRRKIWTKGGWYFLLVALYYCKIKANKFGQKLKNLPQTEGKFSKKNFRGEDITSDRQLKIEMTAIQDTISDNFLFLDNNAFYSKMYSGVPI